MRNRGRRRPTHWYLLRRPIVLVVVVLISILVVARWQYVRFWRSFFGETIRNASRYPEVLNAWKAGRGTGYVAHFPVTVPVKATDIRFYFEPGALQGSTMIEVRFCLPAAEFAAELARAKSLSAAFKPPPALPSFASHIHLLTDGAQEPPQTRLSFLIGAAATIDSWGMTLDPTTGEVAYWAIDD
jgi:hypothetical protein